MNTYTFTYYGFIPGYNDFDIDWFDVKADTPEEAMQLADKYTPFRKSDIELTAINGKNINEYSNI